MHIMELFNQRKKTRANSMGRHNNNDNNGTLERQWRSIYAQCVTGKVSDQTKLIDLISFEDSLYYEDIENSTAKYYHEGMDPINYFGYVS